MKKINFCLGDFLFWRGPETCRFDGRLEDWPDWLRKVLCDTDATDIVYFADRFPYHKEAQRVARRMGVRCVSIEYGYLRPDWLILEEGGQSTYSHFPDDPEQIRDAAKDLPEIDEVPRYTYSDAEEAFCEAIFHVSNGLSWIFTPRYKPDRYYPELLEFPAYIPRLAMRAIRKRSVDAIVHQLKLHDAPVFLVPLQMQNDFQLRDNAPPGFQHAFVEHVLSSFASSAPKDAVLAFKQHPLDNGLERWGNRIRKISKRLAIAERVRFLDGGELHELFQLTSGVVVTNSTMGLRALREGKPVKCMGIAIYDVEGLTDSRPLDDFWTDPIVPDTTLVSDFVRAMAHGIHIRGTIYGSAGKAAFVEAAADRLEQPLLQPDNLFCQTPTRLGKARNLGIQVDWPQGPNGEST